MSDYNAELVDIFILVEPSGMHAGCVQNIQHNQGEEKQKRKANHESLTACDTSALQPTLRSVFAESVDRWS